jgi:hypothetical protein
MEILTVENRKGRQFAFGCIIGKQGPGCRGKLSFPVLFG